MSFRYLWAVRLSKTLYFFAAFDALKLFSFLPDRAIQDEWNLFIDDLSELVDHSDDLFNCEENGFKEDWRTALKIF